MPESVRHAASVKFLVVSQATGRYVTSSPESFPEITATLTATAYLAPETEGATAGATPTGPAPATPATADSQPAVTPPTATAVR